MVGCEGGSARIVTERELAASWDLFEKFALAYTCTGATFSGILSLLFFLCCLRSARVHMHTSSQERPKSGPRAAQERPKAANERQRLIKLSFLLSFEKPFTTDIF